MPPNLRTPGRASQSNGAGRYEPYVRQVQSDGWDIAEEPQLARTEVTHETPRRILTRNRSPDISFDRSINPYRGCEHGCIYCFARPTHAYLGWSPGLDFETRIVARPKAASVLRTQLSRPRYQPAPIAIGTNTDPYQPIEKHYRIMRDILLVLQEFRHPVTVVTKGTLVERDADVLGALAREGLAQVGVSVTSMDPQTSRLMEPRAPGPKRRLQMIETLVSAGIPVRLMVAPVVPGLTDHELESILRAGAEAGAQSAAWIALRLPLEVSGLFQEWLATHYPDRAGKVMGRVRDMHGGQDYDARWGRRMTGEGTLSGLLAQRFAIATARLGLTRDLPPLRTDLFAVPPRSGDQLSLF